MSKLQMRRFINIINKYALAFGFHCLVLSIFFICFQQKNCFWVGNGLGLWQGVIEYLYRMLNVKKKYRRGNLVYLKTCTDQERRSSQTARNFNNRTSQNYSIPKEIPALQSQFPKSPNLKKEPLTTPNLIIKSSINLQTIKQLSKLKAENAWPGKNIDEGYGEDWSAHRVRVLDLLRVGNFGRVYRGVLMGVGGMEVAVKKVEIDDGHKSREDYFAKTLKSPYIVQFIGTYITHQPPSPQSAPTKKTLNIVMKKYSNNLSEILQLETLEPFRTKIYLYQMLRSLLYIHSLNICHRDIKPHNFVIRNERIFLGDFGAAKVIGDGCQGWGKGGDRKSVVYVFQREYRAPQLLFGFQGYGKEVDIWALGCVIAEMVIKKPLFLGSNNLDQLIKILKLTGTPNWSTISFCQDRKPKIPEIKGTGLKQALGPKTDPLLLKLINKMLVIEPRERISAIEALCEPYFDQIREEAFYRAHLRAANLPNFFHFTKRETFGKEEFLNKLVPFWIKQHCKRFEVSIKDYNF